MTITLMTIVLSESDIKEAIRERMVELAPFVTEYERLTVADTALANVPKTSPKPPTAIVGHAPKPEPKRGGKRYTLAEKEAAIAYANRKGLQDSSRAYGIAESTLRGWLKEA